MHGILYIPRSDLKSVFLPAGKKLISNNLFSVSLSVSVVSFLVFFQRSECIRYYSKSLSQKKQAFRNYPGI